MRAAVIALLLVATPAAAVGPEVAFAERSALLGADRTCGLFDPGLRAALKAATAQARGVLLRSGWSEARADDLGRRASAEGAAKRCTDPAVTAAATNARAGFDGWTRVMSMRFAGGERAWTARRTRDADGFYLRQEMTAPRAATFGVRQEGPRAAVALMIPLAANEPMPSGARMYFRDRTRAPRSAADLPGRTRTGLAAMAASHNSATVVWTSGRRLEQARDKRAALLLFPDSVLTQLAALDPREAIEVEVDGARGVTRFYVEVGDYAAAQAFLQAQAGS